MRAALFLLLALGATAPPAPAAECRALLRPLLRSQQPDPAALAATRGTCQAEADAGDADASYQLALFDLGLDGRWQPDAAIPRILDAAARGVAEAQYWLAWQYEAGPLLPNDAALALGWYQRAANADHRLAIARLAEAHAFGELGLERDPLLAAQYRARQSQCMQRATPNAGD
jgi:TPR repeat protein